MKQKKLLALVGSVCLILILAALPFMAACAKPAPPEDGNLTPTPTEVIEWRVQSCFPAGTLYYDYSEDLTKKIEVLSNGRMKIELFPGGALVPSAEALDATASGIIDAHHGNAGMWMGKIASAPAFTALPGGFSAMDNTMWLYYGGGVELWQEMYDEAGYNIKVLPAGVHGMEVFAWSNKPLRNFEDFKGVKARYMPYTGTILTEQGYSVVYLSVQEIISNMQTGVLDAAEYSIPAFDMTIGFPDVATYYTYPGIHQPSAIWELLINKDKWNALPDDLKEVIETACEWEMLHIYTDSESKNIEALKKLDEMGMQKVVMDEEAVITFLGWARDFFRGMCEEDPFFAKVWESQKVWAAKWNPYMESCEYPSVER